MGAATDLAGFLLGDFVLCVWDPENGQRELLFQKVGIKGHDDVTRAFLKDYGLNTQYVTQLLPSGMKSFTSVKYQASGSSS